MTTNIGLNGSGVLALVAVGAVGLIAWTAYKKAPKAAAAVGAALNPMSDTNLAYKAVNGLGGAFSGDSNWSLGGSIYDLLNPAPVERIGAVEEITYDAMGNSISSGLSTSQTRYAKQEASSNGQGAQRLPPALSFGGAGNGQLSFKDQVSPDLINPWRAFPSANFTF